MKKIDSKYKVLIIGCLVLFLLSTLSLIINNISKDSLKGNDYLYIFVMAISLLMLLLLLIISLKKAKKE